MNYPGLEQRLQDLEDNLARERDLLKQYEEVLSYEDEPRRIARCRREIQRQKETIAGYVEEYTELAQQPQQPTSGQLQRLGDELQALDRKIDLLLGGQTAIFTNLDNLRQDVLSRYDEGERAAIAPIARQLSSSQLVLTQQLLDAVERDLVTEQQMSQMLTLVEQRLPSPAEEQSRVVSVPLQDPKTSTKHKLKLTLPLIPTLVKYESEIELGNGFNLKSAWNKLIEALGGL